MDEFTIFQKALDKSTSDREEFVAEACGDDEALLSGVRKLLQEHEKGSGLLDESLDPIGETIQVSAEELKKAKSSSHASDEQDPPSVNVVIEPETKKRVMYFGDYELQGEIARGAMGVVYRAEQKSLKRTVAIKMIRSTLLTNETDVARFHAEAESAASLDHPNIVPIYEVGVHEDQHYFSMKLIEGGTLRDHLDRLREDPKAAAQLMSTVAGAIHAAHQRGILHRDLKPGNILIDKKGEPHVTDFGLAKQMESVSSVTLSGQIMGTPQYMAPEQAEGGGKDLTTAADIYALGAIFYELLCGRPPHRGESLMETLMLVSEQEAEAPSRHAPGIDRDLETIAMKCLEKDPSRRYASAQGLKNDLDRWLRGEPIHARPVGIAEKAVKWMKRKPMHAAASLLAFLLLLTLGIGGPIKAQKEKRLRHEAEAARAEAEANARKIRVQAYSADMNVAAHAIEDHRFAKAKTLLDRHIPKVGEEDIRGFEWQYLSKQAKSDDLGIVGEYEALRGGVAVSPDSTLMAHCTPVGIDVRDARTGDLIQTLTLEETKTKDYARGVLKFSPDGTSLLCVKAKHILRWRTDTWQSEPTLTDIGWPLAFAHDKPIVIALTGDYFVVRDAKTFEKIRILKGRFERARFYNFNSVVSAVTPDGSAFFAGEGRAVSGVGMIRRWDVTTGDEQSRILPYFNGPQCLTVSSKGILAACNWDGNIALWNTNTSKWIQTLDPHIAWSPMVAFSDDGSLLVSISADETICVFDIDEKGEATLRTRLAGHEDEIWAIAMARDGYLFTGSKDGTARKWKIPARDYEPYAKFHLMRGVGFTDNSQSLIVFAKEKNDRTLGFHRLDLTTGEFELIPTIADPETLESVAKINRILPTNTHFGEQQRMAVGSLKEPNKIEIWNLKTGDIEITLPEASHQQKQYRGDPFAFSPDGTLFATANETNGIRLYDCSDWSHRELVPDFGGRTELRISADNRILAAVPPLPDQEGIAVEIATGRIIARFTLSGLSPEHALSDDGRFLAMGSTDREIQVWDLERGEKIHSLRGHVAGIRGLAFSPDGRTLATCGDQRLKLWNVQTGTELLVLAHGVAEIGDPYFSPDGRTLFTSAMDQYLRIWRVPSWEELAEGSGLQ